MRRRRRRPGRTAFWYKYIPLAMDVSDQNVFLSKYIIFSHSEICWGGREVFLHGSFLAFAFSCLELKFNLI